MTIIQEVNKFEFENYDPDKIISKLSFGGFATIHNADVYILFCKELKKFMIVKNRFGNNSGIYNYPLEFLADFLLNPAGKLIVKYAWE